MKSSMTLLLSDTKRFLDVNRDALRIFLISDSSNVSVTKSILWKDGTVNIYVNNKKLPQDHFLWNVTHMQDRDNLGEVSDCLARLAHLLEHSHICAGVQNYEDQWQERKERGFGFIEERLYAEKVCYRATRCSGIVNYAQVCAECKGEYLRMKAKKYRQSHAKKDADKSRANYRYRDRDELIATAEAYHARCRTKDKLLSKLRKRVKDLIPRCGLTVGSDLSTDLSKVFQKHQDSMTEAQKIFWSEQLKALSKQNCRKSMRWSPFVIRLALHLQMVSQSAYKYLQNFIQLPSERLLYDYTHYLEARVGAQEEIMKEVSSKIRNSLPGEKQFHILMYDEMTVRSDLVFTKRTGEIVGYVHLDKVELELLHLESELGDTPFEKNKPAKKVLVFMLQGITNDIKEVVGIYPTDNLTAVQLYTRCWDVIFKLEKNELPVIALVCDGASANRKIFKMHGSADKTSKFVYVTKNFASGDERDLFFLVDPSHLLKTLRNCFANSYAHRNTRKMWKNGCDISWETIQLLYEVSLHQKFQSTRVKKVHVHLTSFSCMSVLYAAQVMSKSVVKALKNLRRSDRRFAVKVNDELLTFISHVNDSFDCLNGGDEEGERIQDNDLLLPYTDVNDTRFSFLKTEVLNFFEDWHSDVHSRKGRYSKEARDAMFISTQSYEALQITIYGFTGAVKHLLKENVGPIKGRSFNQDKLEQYFGLMRMAGGANTNPSASEFCFKSLNLHSQATAAQPPSKGNTTVCKKTIVVDQTPLKKRKAQRRKT